jgi:hypothetical protein
VAQRFVRVLVTSCLWATAYPEVLVSKFRTVVGLEYSGKRVEAGQIVSDIPEGSVSWLRTSGFIEGVAEPSRDVSPEPVEPEAPKKAAAKKTSRKAGS